MPEKVLLDRHNTERLLKVIEEFSPEQIIAPEELLEHFQGQKFDIIFFDPVHLRPEVDRCINNLLQLLVEDGLLVMHDCSPRNECETTIERVPGNWCGQTYKAFALFRYFNPTRCFTIDEDFGVGVIINRDLRLDYPLQVELDYARFDAQRAAYLGLCSHAEFCQKLVSGDKMALFADCRSDSRAVLQFPANVPELDADRLRNEPQGENELQGEVAALTLARDEQTWYARALRSLRWKNS